MNILVVDDDADQRLVLRSVLAMEGWTVFLAENGEEALAKMALEKIDLIVSDIYMPVMDGIKFHKTLRATPPFETIPFLFISCIR